MKKILIMAAAVAALATPAFAQDPAPADGWQHEYELSLNMLQSSYSQNWNGGDKGSVNWTGAFNGRLERQYGESRNWRSTACERASAGAETSRTRANAVRRWRMERRLRRSTDDSQPSYQPLWLA